MNSYDSRVFDVMLLLKNKKILKEIFKKEREKVVVRKRSKSFDDKALRYSLFKNKRLKNSELIKMWHIKNDLNRKHCV